MNNFVPRPHGLTQQNEEAKKAERTPKAKHNV